MRHDVHRLFLFLILFPVFVHAQSNRDTLTPWLAVFAEGGIAGNAGEVMPPPVHNYYALASSVQYEHLEVRETISEAFRVGAMTYPLRFGRFSLGTGAGIMYANYRGTIGKERIIVTQQWLRDTSYKYNLRYKYVELSLQFPLVLRYNFFARPGSYAHCEIGAQLNYAYNIYYPDDRDLNLQDEYRTRFGVAYTGGVFYTWDIGRVQAVTGITGQLLAGSTDKGRKPWLTAVRVGIGIQRDRGTKSKE
jgi:hypothetical protein